MFLRRKIPEWWQDLDPFTKELNDILLDFSEKNRTAQEKGVMITVSKHDYNYQLLLVIVCIIFGVAGLMGLGALIMFLTAFM